MIFITFKKAVFSTLRDFTTCSGGCSVAKNLKLCLFTSHSNGNGPRHWSEKCPKVYDCPQYVRLSFEQNLSICLVDLLLLLKNLHFVTEQFQIVVSYLLQSSTGNLNLPLQPSGGITRQLFQLIPHFLNPNRRLAVNFRLLWLLLLSTTLSMPPNFSNKRVIAWRWGVFFWGFWHWSCLWTKVGDFVAKYSFTIFVLFSTIKWLKQSIL